jgi:Rrf2 family protein
MISQTAEYALRAMLFLSVHRNAPSVSQEIAKATRVPAGYLSKVLQNLCRAGLVSSQRGLGGGFLLSRPAAEISVYEVIQAVDPFRLMRRSAGESAEYQTVLHKRLDDAMGAVERIFRNSTIADLLKDHCPSAAQCQCPFQEQCEEKGKSNGRDE